MADEERPLQIPKEWKRFTRAFGSYLPTRLVQTRRMSKRIRALGGKRG